MKFDAADIIIPALQEPIEVLFSTVVEDMLVGIDEPSLIIDGVELVQTCYACPEQYDVLDGKGNMLAYLRLRHGQFTVECPDVGDKLVLCISPEGDGIFKEHERDFYLKLAVAKIKEHYAKTSETSSNNDDTWEHSAD